MTEEGRPSWVARRRTSSVDLGAGSPFGLVAIGTSWGGLHAIETILMGIPPDFPIPIAIVQHRRKDSDDTLARILSKYTALDVEEVEDKSRILPGRVYVAPADYHLLVDTAPSSTTGPYPLAASTTGASGAASNEAVFALSTDEPVGFSRPSIDVFFESSADVFRHKLVGVILTGANRDGTRGMKRIRTAGGVTIAEDPVGAECPIMPKSAIDEGAVERVLPLSMIGPFLATLVRRPPSSRPRMELP